MKFQELFDPLALSLVKRCSNFPIDNSNNPEDIQWKDNLLSRLNSYNGETEYFQTNYNNNSFGRFYVKPIGLQSLPCEIRHFLAKSFYIDIDVINCHPVIIYNLFLQFNLKIPSFLYDYVFNRQQTMTKYNITKLDVIKIINTETINQTFHIDILNFHKCLFNDLFPILQNHFSDIVIKKESNLKGSLFSLYLQNYENDILQCV